MSGRKQTFAPLSRSFDLSRESINEDARTVDVVFSTDTDQVERWFGVEILDHSKGAVRMGRLSNKAPLLMDHDSRDQVGVIETAKIEGNRGLATVRFSKSARGEEVFQDVKDGIRSKISVGYRVHKLVMESRDSGTGRETYRVTDWEPFEVSFIAIPADDSAGVREGQSIFGQRAAELSTQIRMEINENNERAALGAEAPAAPAAPVAVEAPKEAARAFEADKQLTELEISKLADQRASAEVQRRDDIRELAAKFSRPDTEVREAIKSGSTVDDFKRSLLDKLSAEHPAFVAPRADDAPTSEKGSRAHTLATWAESAKRALGNKGVSIIIPDYSREKTVERQYIGENGTTFHRSLSGAVTLLDVAKLDAGIGAPVIDETSIVAPEATVFPVDVINGSTVELSVLTGTPTVGFRNANEGRLSRTGTFETKVFQTQVIEEPIVVDIQGVLNASKDPGRVLMQQASAVSRAVIKHIGTQTWYAGTAQSADTKAAPGLIAQSNTASTHYVDASGGSAKSSVYFVRLGNDSCDHVYGNGTTLNFGEEWMEETVESAAGYKLRALVNYISGRVAPRLANKNALVRIKNLAASTQILTDALMFQALQKFLELGTEPNAIFMSPRSLYQLQAGRTATNPSGSPAPLPRDFEGIPIYHSNSISNAETV